MKKKFAVGDWVVITKSCRNWTDTMNKFVGTTVQITQVELEAFGEYVIKFEGCMHYYWSFKEKHFRKAKLKESPDYVPSERCYKYLIPIWKKLKII